MNRPSEDHGHGAFPLVLAAVVFAGSQAEAQTPAPAPLAAPAAAPAAPAAPIAAPPVTGAAPAAPAAGGAKDPAAVLEAIRAALGPDKLDCDGKPCPPKVELPPCDPKVCKCPTKDCEKPKIRPKPKPKPKPVPPPPPPDMLPLENQDFCPPRFGNHTVTPPKYYDQTSNEPGYTNTPGDPVPQRVEFYLRRVDFSTKVVGWAELNYEDPFGGCQWKTDNTEPVTDEFAPEAPVRWQYTRTDPPVRTLARGAAPELCGKATYTVDEEGRLASFEIDDIPGAPDGLKIRIYPPNAVLINGTKGWGAETRPVVYGGRPNPAAWKPDEKKIVCVPKI